MSAPLFRFLFLLWLSLAGALAHAEDPPALVGRIAYIEGAVDFQPTYQDARSAAVLNWPVTTDNVISTRAFSRVEIRAGSTIVRLDADSTLEFAELNDDALTLYLTRGTASVRLVNPDIADGFSLRTPQGLLRVADTASLRVDTSGNNDNNGTTLVTVRAGAAQFDSDRRTLSIPAGSQGRIGNGDLEIMQLSSTERTDFDSWNLARDRLEDSQLAQRYVAPETTGYELLDRNGSWQENTVYGAVWIPYAVASGWAPYRDGRWAWCPPWGWTWIDRAPWAYAPSHYGRWAQLDRGWAWVPGPRAQRPAWAPAVVGWQGDRRPDGFRRAAPPASGWFPLTPHDQFQPFFPASPRYVQRLNAPYGQRDRQDWQHRSADRERRSALNAPSQWRGPNGIGTPANPVPRGGVNGGNWNNGFNSAGDNGGWAGSGGNGRWHNDGRHAPQARPAPGASVATFPPGAIPRDGPLPGTVIRQNEATNNANRIGNVNRQWQHTPPAAAPLRQQTPQAALQFAPQAPPVRSAPPSSAPLGQRILPAAPQRPQAGFQGERQAAPAQPMPRHGGGQAQGQGGAGMQRSFGGGAFGGAGLGSGGVGGFGGARGAFGR